MRREEDSAGEFWRTSLELYGREGMSDALIALQERRGADVNLLLYCCWTALSGRGRLNAGQLRRADEAVAGWRDEVTLPLRALRTRIKRRPERWALDGATEVRRRVLEAELASERVTQGILEDLALAPERSGGRREEAQASLRAYFEVLGVQPDERDRTDLETILALAWEGGPPRGRVSPASE